jgi:hypothetical protein
MSPALLAVALAAVAAPAPEEAIKPPMGQPPSQVVASMTKEGEFEIVQTVLVPEARNEERTVVVNGTTVKQVVQVTVFVPVQRTFRMKAEGAKVSTAGGKEVNAKDVPDKLKKPTIVLLAMDGEKVDPFYLKIIKPETLVIVAASRSSTPDPKPAPRPKD